MNTRPVSRYLSALLSFRLLWFLTAAGAISLLAYGLYRNWEELAQYEWQLNYRPLALSFALYSTALFIAIWGWHSIMGRLGSRARLARDAKLYCYSNLAKRLPTSVWLFASRAYLYEREGMAKRVTSLGTLLELSIIALTGVMISLSTSAPFPRSWLIERRGAVILVVFAPLVVLLIRPRFLVEGLNILLAKLHREGVSVALRRRDMLWWSLLYSLVWLLGGLSLFSLIGSLRPLPASSLPLVIWAWSLSGLGGLFNFALPLGVGVKELALAYLLSFCLPLSAAIVISIASRVWLTLCELFWLLLSLRL